MSSTIRHNASRTSGSEQPVATILSNRFSPASSASARCRSLTPATKRKTSSAWRSLVALGVCTVVLSVQLFLVTEDTPAATACPLYFGGVSPRAMQEVPDQRRTTNEGRATVARLVVGRSSGPLTARRVGKREGGT